jgi:F-type H+-transporting ATPase subunit delta
MQNPRLGTRYAKSLIDLSVERGQLEIAYTDMTYLQELTKNRDFMNLLRSPVVKSDTKIKVVDAVIKGNVSELTDAFIRLMINKARESNLPEVITAFIAQYKKIKNIHTVKLTTASPVSDSVKNAIVAQIRSSNSDMQNIDLETKVDPDIIGGFVLQTGDKLIDASISHELRQVSRQFENNDFIYKVR